MNYENVNEINKNLERLISEGKLNNKQIVIFGAPDSAEIIDSFLRQRGLKISEVINNDKSLEGKQLETLGISIKPPGALFTGNIKRYVVLIASRHYDAMLKQLSKYGFTENKNIFLLADYKFHNNSDLSVKSFFFYLLRVYNGWKLKQRLFKQLGLSNGGKLYVLGYCALGDAYIICSLLKANNTNNNSHSWALIIQERDVIRKITDMFGIKKIAAASYSDRLLLLTYAQFYGEGSGVEFICLSRNRVNDLSKAFGIKGLNMMDIFQQAFQLYKKGAAPNPTVWVPGADNPIQPGRTVILFPYAYTAPLFDKQLWVCIAEKLTNIGYLVLTNTAGDNEPPVEGTHPINIPVEHAVGIVEYAGGVIMNRSGICDVISSAKCKKVILYPAYERFNKADLIKIFGLKNMGMCSDAIEIQFNEKTDIDVILSEILNNFTMTKIGG